MKSLIKFIILAIFAVVIFFRSYVPVPLYWSLFIVMFGLVVAFYFISYWVSQKDVEKETGKPVGFSLFGGKLPVISDDDLIRGRLVIDASNITLYKRIDGKERTSEHHCVEVWSIPVSEIASIGTGPIISSARKGLILYLEDGGEVKFICRKAIKCKPEILDALGWHDVPEVSPGFGTSVDVAGPASTAKSFSEALAKGVDEEPDEPEQSESTSKNKKRKNKKAH